jgi:DNA-binding MarR family transcriptional regulator
MSPEPAEDLTTAIRTVIRLGRVAQQSCEEVGITLPQYRALSMATGTRRRAHEMAAYTAVSRPAIAAVTAGLEKAGLLDRTIAEHDKRGVYYVATDEGRRVVRDVEERMAERFTAVLGPSLPLVEALSDPALESALDAEAARTFGPVEFVTPPPSKP